MVPTFPPELWLRIGQFIPSEILRNLYSVNSVFLELALNERYSNISLVHLTATSTKILEHLKWPHIAHRVKRLTIVTDWFMANLCMSLQSVDKITTRMAIACSLPFDLGRFIDRTAWIIFRSKKYYKLLASLVVNFSNISYLVIIQNVASPQPQTDILVMNSYTACASNLKKLRLIIKSANFNAFPPNAPELKSVEEVDLIFSPLSESGALPKAAPTFLLAIASRLTTLNLLFCDTDIDKILQSFPRGRAVFPKLTSFSLSHAGSPTAPSSDLTQFLNQHADTLKHLSLQFTKLPPFTFQSFDDLGHTVDPIVLPHIETLNFASSLFSRNTTHLKSHEGLDAVRAYAQHIGSTLTSLSLWHCSFTLLDLGILLDLLTQGSGRPKRLILTVEALSPQMLDILAEKLPQLEELTVNFDFLRSCDVPGAILTDVDHSSRGGLTIENFEPFLPEMETRYYQNWSLRSLAIDHGPRRTRMDPEVVTRFLLGLARCMPHLVEISGPLLLWKRPGVEYAWTKYE